VIVPSEMQLDALTEVFNIGTGRAASSLSEIIGDEVKLSVPRIQLLQASEANTDSLFGKNTRLGAVQQNFSGPFNINAMLLFTEERALEIVRDMMGSQLSLDELADYEQEAMCELGNVILNACLSAMSDMLKLSLNSSLPLYSVDSSETILSKVFFQENQPVILVLHINLVIEKRRTQGYLVFLLSSASLENLFEHIDAFISGI
jgi:chemotaxis protein CheC